MTRRHFYNYYTQLLVARKHSILSFLMAAVFAFASVTLPGWWLADEQVVSGASLGTVRAALDNFSLISPLFLLVGGALIGYLFPGSLLEVVLGSMSPFFMVVYTELAYAAHSHPFFIRELVFYTLLGCTAGIGSILGAKLLRKT